jgi:hypothetical protein
LGLSACFLESAGEHVHLVGIEVAVPIESELSALVAELADRVAGYDVWLACRTSSGGHEEVSPSAPSTPLNAVLPDLIGCPALANPRLGAMLLVQGADVVGCSTTWR